VLCLEDSADLPHWSSEDLGGSFGASADPGELHDFDGRSCLCLPDPFVVTFSG
jgi:hypothetical protein